MTVAVRWSRLLRALGTRAARLVALLAWVGQLALVGAPLIEAGAEPNRATHVEADTNPLHHAHNPDLCPACAALAMVGRPEAARPPLPLAARVHRQPSPRVAAHPVARALAALRPRAPPAWESDRRSVRRTDFDSHPISFDAISTLAVRAPAGRDGHGTRAAAGHGTTPAAA